MKRFRKKAVVLLLVSCVFAFSIQSFGASGFVSEAGVFDYMAPPQIPLPRTEGLTPCENWFGDYYAPGTGLEVRIRRGDGFSIGKAVSDDTVLDDDPDDVFCNIINYAGYEVEYIYSHYINRTDDGGRSGNDFEGNEVMIFSPIKDGRFTITFSDTFIKNAGCHFENNTIEFIDTSILVKENSGSEISWEGAYFQDSVDNNGVYLDYTTYISIIPIYNTGDYLVVFQGESHGQDDNSCRTEFFSEQDGYLLQLVTGIEGSNSIVPPGETWIESMLGLINEGGQTVLCWPQIGQGITSMEAALNIISGLDENSVSYFFKCSVKPMWDPNQISWQYGGNW